MIAEKNPIAPEQIERAKAPTRDMLLGDRYRLEVILGEGGMGHVWAARDLKLDRPVAIKLLPEDMLGDTRRALRFAAEARFAGRVSHPNILTLHDASTDGDRPYLVFERLEGTSLREQMQRPLSVDQATIFACWIARGLAAAHKKAIVHRDLKPENIFVTSDGWLKILDFGVAKELTQVAAGGGDTLTSDGGFVGTVGYASPEQLRGEPLSPAADLFSFGCVLHEMLRDELPFVGETRAELARATLSDAPHSLPAWVSPTLVECVARCLEKDPAKRPRADALADLLAQGVQGREIVSALRMRSENPLRRGWLIGASVLAASITVGAMAFLVLPRFSHPKTAPDARLDMLAKKAAIHPAALAAFRKGEQALQRGDREVALREYQEAVAAEPDFSLAKYRVAIAADFSEPGKARDALESALHNATALDPREHSLLEAYGEVQKGNAPRAEKLYRSVVAEHPDDVEAWTRLGELIFRFASLEGRPQSDAEEPLLHAVALAPYNAEALAHLIDLAQMNGQWVVADQLVDRYLEGTQATSHAQAQFRWLKALIAGDGAGRASALHEAAVSNDLDLQQELFIRASWESSRVGDARSLAEQLRDESSSPLRRAVWVGAIGLLEAAHGHVDEARRLFAESAQLSPGGMAPYIAAWFETLDDAHPTPAQLAAARRFAASIDAARAPQLAAARFHLLGTLAAHAGDFTVAAESAAALDLLPPIEESSICSDLALAVRAHMAEAKGHDDEALALLGRMANRVGYRYVGFFGRLAQPELRARILTRQNEWAEAARWNQLFYGAPLEITSVSAVHTRQAALYSNLGDAAAASAHAAIASAWLATKW